MDVIVLTTYYSGSTSSEDDVKVFRTIPNFLESYVPNNALYKALRYFFLPAATFLSILFIFLRYRPRLIHAHSSTSITPGACVFSLFFRVPIVIDVQDMFPAEFPLKWVIKIGFAPRYIAIGNEIAKMLLSINIPAQKILTLPLTRLYEGNDTTYNPEKKRDNDKVSILFVGGLTKIKGIDVLLEAFKLASQKSKKLSMKIIGDGPMRGYCEEFIYKNDLNVKLSGILNHKKTLEEIYSADIVILASRTEGYPRVIMEAFEFEKPVIATRVGGIPELLKDGGNGILVDPCDPAGLAEGILMLGNDKELREKLGKRGKQSLKNSPSFEEVSRKILEFYGL